MRRLCDGRLIIRNLDEDVSHQIDRRMPPPPEEVGRVRRDVDAEGRPADYENGAGEESDGRYVSLLRLRPAGDGNGGENEKEAEEGDVEFRADRKAEDCTCLLYTSPSPRDLSTSRMPSSA